MKKVSLAFLLVGLCIALFGCCKFCDKPKPVVCCEGKADLIVYDTSINWAAANKTVTAYIINAGDTDAGPFDIHFYGEENPVSTDHLPRILKQVGSLAVGASREVIVEFAPLAHQDNNFLGNINAITIIVKAVGDECSTNNNRASIVVP